MDCCKDKRRAGCPTVVEFGATSYNDLADRPTVGGVPLEGDVTELIAGLAAAGGGRAEYGGPYEVEPTAGGLTVPTAGRVMRSDLVIAPIPVHEAENPSGGLTATIG